MFVMFLADGLGVPLIKGNPLPETVQLWIQKHPEAIVGGTVYRREDTEYSEAVYLKNSYYIYQSEKVSIENVKVYMREKTEVPPGAVIVVSGTLKETEKARNPGGFDEQEYYASQHIFYLMKSAELLDISDDVRESRVFLMKIKKILSEILCKIAGEDAPVFQAMLLGEKTDLDAETKTMYQMAGIIHILAISGLHISMLGMGLYQVLKKSGAGLFIAGLLSLFVMIQYGIMTGSGVSTMRAVCMFLLNVGAQMLGRIYDLPTALSVSAILLLLEAPANLHSNSFQLSFGAVAAIGLVMPLVKEIWPIRFKWMETLLSSVTVQIVTLPVVLKAYGEVSILGILWNLLVLPTVGTVLFCGTAGCFIGMLSFLAGVGSGFENVFFQLAEIVIMPGRLLLWIYEKMCGLSGRIRFSVWIAGEPKNWQVILYYGILAAVFVCGYCGEQLWENAKERHWNFIRKIVLVMSLLLNAGMLGMRIRPELQITCLDVGQGDGIVLETREGENFLIDCGSTSERAVGQYCLLPFMKSKGISYLDAIMVSHTDEDHISGIKELLEQISKHLTTIRVGKVILPEWKQKGEAYLELEVLAQKAGAELVLADQGDRIQMKKGVFKVLRPIQGSTGENTNEEGMVLQLEYGSFDGLFMGDVGTETEKSLLAELSEVSFLKVGHHGSANSSSREFLEVISPEIAVISCAFDNSYGHPAAETVERLLQAGCQVEYTMTHGAIILSVNKEDIKTERFWAF